MSKVYKSNDSLFIKCDCYSHAMEVYYENEDDTFCCSIWELGITSPMSWKDRFRWVYQVLKTGNPWADQIILTRDCANELTKYIKENNKQ